MKIAYLAFDRTCIKSSSYFQSQGHDVQYFLINESENLSGVAFYKIDILVNNIMIPAYEKMRTDQQKKNFLDITSTFNELRDLIANPEPQFPVEDSSEKALEKNPMVTSLNQINDIQVDPKQRKVFLELAKKGVENFDHLLIEGHPFISDCLFEKKINIVKNSESFKYVWSGLTFDIEFLQPLTAFSLPRSFFMVQDSSRKNVVDNWLLCQIVDKQVTIWTFLPLHQIKNPEFQKFYIERIKTAVGKKIDFLLFKSFRDFYFSTVGASASMLEPKRGPVVTVPNFMYWGQAEVKKYFDITLTKKLKILQQQAEAKP